MSYEEGDGRADGIGGAPVEEAHGKGSSGTAIPAASRAPRQPSFAPDALDAYRETGLELIPLHSPRALGSKGQEIGKAPLLSGWRDALPLSFDAARQHLAEGKNVGVRLRPCDLVVDVDPRNFLDGDDPYQRLQDDLGVDFDDYPRVITGSGGYHVYMLKPDEALLVDSLETYQGVEFKTHGRQVVAAGSSHPTSGEPYLWDSDPLAVSIAELPDRRAPDALLALAARRVATAGADTGGGFTPEELEVMLEGLDVTKFRDEGRWRELMMACHHATGGDGRDKFIAWSTGDPEYRDDAHVIGRRWDSLHADVAGRRVTCRTLFKALHEVGRGELIPRPTAEDDFADEPDFEAPTHDQGSSAAPASAALSDQWVWVAGIERFVRRSDTTKFSKDQFKSMFWHRWPEGDICAAVWKGKLPISRVEALAYVPSQPEFVATGPWAGRYNLWRPSGVEPRAGDVSVFLEHMAYLFPDEIERGHVLDYLSFLVAPQFVKVHYALLVRGRQGTGKSFLGKLIRTMIGDRNVSMPTSSEVREQFTGWQEGAQLAILEEMMALGEAEVANRLKPVVTEDYLRIRLMHTNAYTTPNFLNLLCFTNHKNSLPIEDGDRRWLVVFSDVQPREQAYYDRLWTCLEGDGPAAVKHFLQQRRINLDPKGRAPATRGKAEMRRLSQGEAEQYLLDQMEEGSAPFDFDLVRLDDVYDAVPSGLRGKGLRARLPDWLDSQLGARRHGRYTKGDRPAWNLWSIRDHDAWEQRGPASRIDAFLAHTKQV
ncbi:hypothetical protein GCM10022268_25440 [Sphingomonas cynarae]|uniref:DNA primase/polymerase bifunctional N-terminal domain-containing protein n=1 Tax=Sphingomonas cynarae TaxID=930197 RepID=A0ABP7E9J3_9SPHN